MPAELKEKYVVCKLADKPRLLYKYIEEKGLRKVLIFARSVVNVHRLKTLLRCLLPEWKIREISSGITVKKQNNAIKQFNDGIVDM